MYDNVLFHAPKMEAKKPAMGARWRVKLHGNTPHNTKPSLSYCCKVNERYLLGNKYDCTRPSLNLIVHKVLLKEINNYCF